MVEIVGPAGAGKTTLYQALDRHPEFIRLENFPDVRKVADAPFFILNGLQLIPSLLRTIPTQQPAAYTTRICLDDYSKWMVGSLAQGSE